MEIRILKRGEKSYIELPTEFLSSESVEAFKLKDGYYLLTIPLANAKKTTEGENGTGDTPITEDEKGVLRKLLEIRFEKRVPSYVAGILDDKEKKTLAVIEKKGFVTVYKGGKYKDGVYNINDSIYPLINKNTASQIVTTRGELPQQAPAQRIVRAADRRNPEAILSKDGFLIVNDKNEARELSERMAQSMKSGAVVGIRGFDGKFYLVTREFFDRSQRALASILTGEMEVAKLAQGAKLTEDGCLAVLRLMADNGEIIEKRKGVFSPI